MQSPLSNAGHDRAQDRSEPCEYWCRTLGELALYRDRVDANPLMQAGKPVAIIVYLALAPRKRADRDHVAELFWPGVTLSDAHHSLRQTLYRLRQVTDAGPLVRSQGTYLELLERVRFDCLDGEQAADRAEWGHAAQVLRGNFLEGFSIPESQEFESWVESQRARFRDGWARAAEYWSRQQLEAGRAADALDAAEELARLRPFDVAPVQLVMAALAQLGRHAGALARYHAYTEFLKNELDEEPAPELHTYAGEIDQYLKTRSQPSVANLPVVGRATEWSELENCWRAAQTSSESATVLIEGAAGFGKTRLLAELRGRVEGAGGIVLSAKCFEIERTVPYAAIGEALACGVRCLGLAKLSGPWLAETTRILPELREAFPTLPSIASVEFAEAAKRRLHQALAHYVEALAGEAPVLLAVDDIHWADAPSLEVLHFLTHRLGGSRVLMIATYRPAELSPVARRFARSICTAKLARLVILNPLTPDDVTQLLGSLGTFESPELGAAAGEHLHRHSAGNPLFLSELLEALARTKVLTVRDGQWTAAANAQIEDLPRTLGKLMADRIDALAPWMRAFVETLAVGAEELAVEILATSLDVSEPRAALALGVLEEERLARRVGPESYELVHDELRRLVYQGIPDERRRLLHSAVGRALELHGGAKRAGGAARLAYHFDQAGDPKQARHYALVAAEEAGALGSAEARQAHLEIAAAHAPKALPPASVPRARPSWWTRQRAIAATVIALLLAAGGLAAGLYLGPATASGSADYRQGMLYLSDNRTGGTYRIKWPRSLGEVGSVVEVSEPLDHPPRLLARAVAENGETHDKIFLRGEKDTVQLTFGRSDDQFWPQWWAPDRRAWILVRGWRESETRYRSNLFLLDRAGRVLRRLTDVPHQDGAPAWSPTGAQFAFMRNTAAAWSLWIADFDGANPRNLTSALGLPRHVGTVAFSPDGQKLAVLYADTGSGFGAFQIVDLARDDVRPLGGPRRYLSPNCFVWSPDGRFLAYATTNGDKLVVMAESLDGAVGPRVVAELPQSMDLIEWVPERPKPKYAAAVVVSPAAVALRVGVGLRMSGRAVARNREPISAGLRWFTTDTSIARVDESGFVRGRSPGRTYLVASAGGFVAETVSVTVARASVDTLFREDWSNGLDTTRWLLFGQPHSLIVDDAPPDGRSAFLNNGDYNHGSGAVSAAAFLVDSAGLTLETEAWLSFTGQHWQIWQLGLLADRPTPLPAEMGSGVTIQITGGSPTVAQQTWRCSDQSHADWQPSMSRRWLRIAIQLRPDSYVECYLEGKLIGKAVVPPEARDRPVSVTLRGHSVATRIYHGRVLVTRGLRY